MIRVTNEQARFVGSLGASPLRTTEVTARFISDGHQSVKIDATQIFVNVLTTRPASATTRQATMLDLRFLATRRRSTQWSDEVLLYDIFPTDIGYHSVGSDRFATDVVVVDSGSDQRSSRWDQPLVEFDVAYGVRTVAQLQALRSFFKVARGRLNSFLFFDWMDHSSLEYATIDADNPDPVSATDQFLGTGDYSTTTFQLQKTYKTPSGDNSFLRPITKPQDGSVLVAVDGVSVSNFSVDKMTGIVTFTPRWSMTGLNGVTLQNVNVSGFNCDVVLPATNPAPASVAVGDRITLAGFSSGLNNVDIANPILVKITSISSDRLTLHLVASNVPTSSTVFAAVTGAANVSLTHYPAPYSNQTITAGYQFYVPVRFDTDRLPISLEDYGTGTAGEVKLIEVRPYDL